MPVVSSLAAEFEGKARFIVVEADREGDVLERFGASSFPAYLVFKDGSEVSRLSLNFTSILIEARLRAMVNDALD